MRVFTTGGCGFIGSNFILDWINENRGQLVNVDCLNYAEQLANLKEIEDHPLYTFIHGNINDRSLISNTLMYNAPDCVIHFAGESHTLNGPHQSEHFLINNVIGTFNLLEETLNYWRSLPADAQQAFRFIHISTSEVYGGNDQETISYQPNNLYAASKASADHFVRAYCHTYGLPTITIHTGNIYGPRQYSEKLIPTMLQQALSGQQLTLGNGKDMRDWLYVGDAVAAISLIAEHGVPGEVYNIGGEQGRSNLSLIQTMCQILERKIAHPGIASFESLIQLVQDEANTDACYIADNDKVRNELGWNAHTSLHEGLDATISWYLQQWSIDMEKIAT